MLISMSAPEGVRGVRFQGACKTTPGQCTRPPLDPFEAVVAYVAQRLVNDPHVCTGALYDEAVDLSYPLSYPSFTRLLRERGLRQHLLRVTEKGRFAITQKCRSNLSSLNGFCPRPSAPPPRGAVR